MGWRRIGAVGTLVAGILAVAAPWLPWFRVTVVDGPSSSESLALTSYGSFMAFLGAVLLASGLAGLRAWESWRGWAVIGAAASVFVLSAGLRGGLDPLGAAKESLRPTSPVVAAAGVSTARGYRERVRAAFDRSTLRADALAGCWVAAAAGAVGAAASLPFASRRRTRGGAAE